MTVTVARWTLADYHQMIETGLLQDRRVELLDGPVIEMAPEGPEHAEYSTLLNTLFGNAAGGRYRVREAKPISLAASNSEPEPDIALVRDKSYRQAHPKPADIFLVIEFSQSSLAKATEAKRLVCATAGVEDYWVVNLRDRQVIVLSPASRGRLQAARDSLCRGAGTAGVSRCNHQREPTAGGLSRCKFGYLAVQERKSELFSLGQVALGNLAGHRANATDVASALGH